MLRDFKFLRRNSGKNTTQQEEIENVPVNPRDSMGPPTSSTDSTRPPLNTIQETTRGVKVTKIDKTPAKRRYSDITKTPEKPVSLLPKGRYGWAKKADSSSSSVEEGDEGKTDAGQSRKVAANATPRSTRTTGRANSNYSESHSNQTTPSKSVTKPPNPAFSLASGSRALASGAARMANYAALSRGIPISGNSSTVVDKVEVPHFDLKENPSFWLEHNVQVLIRVRPLNSTERSTQGYSRCLKQESAQCITWIGQPETRFTFDHVACETINQETLFRMVGLPMVENCLSGYNSSIFAYGQTGSGKTHTMLGEIEELEVRPSPNRGMTPRIFEFLFARIRAEEESRRDERLQYSCKCSFLEIYNEQITDLLDPSSTNLMLREDMTKGVYVENLSEFEVRTVGDILKLLTQGSLNRRVAATNMNRESSRSHSVFTCIIESRWEKNCTDNFRFSRLNLVDLAGSERQKASGAEGERLKEAASINKSLSTLGHVIMVLVDVANGRPRHVPYRDSKLTFLLQDSLGGNSKTMIISNVSPSICCAAETLNTLKFAQRAKLIQNNAVVNEDSSADVTALKHEIRLLKEELSSLKSQNVSRALSFGQTTVSGDSRLEDDSSYDETDQHGSSMITKEAKGIVRLSTKQFKSLETTLAGSLRREQMAETSIKQLEAEIEQLNRLVRQREEDNRCTKMMLKFREERIQRMESLVNGLIPADSYLLEENNALTEEIQLLQAKVDRNPEVTRFACENIRLLEELRRFQDFYEEGEREILLSEVSNLRDQLLTNIDGNLKKHNHLDMNIPSQESVHVCDEQTTLHLELKKTLHELEECRTNLNCCLEKNKALSREIDELRGSLNSISSANNDHNDGVEVRKESISEALALNSKSKTSDEKEKEDTRKEETMKHIEKIMDLQLELDILKVIVQEERLHHKELEQHAQSMMLDLDSSKEQLLLVTKKCEDVHAELGEAKSIIEALESQHLLAITEVEDLRNSNNHYAEVVQNQELEISSLKKQMFHQGSRNLSSSKLLESNDSSLQAKLKKMYDSLEKAKMLNQHYQSDSEFHVSNEEAMDEISRQAEAETAAVIVCLQEELLLLQQEVRESSSKEMESRKRLNELETEVNNLEAQLSLMTEENRKLGENVYDKEKELINMSEEWEKVNNEIEAIVCGGHEALKDACEQLDFISSTFPNKRSRISEQFGRMTKHIFEKELLIEQLSQSLENALNRKNDMESMLRSLRGAALVMMEAHQLDCRERDAELFSLTSQLSSKAHDISQLENTIKYGEDQLRKASVSATVAFLVLNWLSEQNSNYIDALNQKAMQLMESLETSRQKDAILRDQASLVATAENQNESLRMELQTLQLDCHEKDAELFSLTSQLSSKAHDISQLENTIKYGEDQLRKASVSATVAFLVVNWLSEQNSNYIDALNQKDMQLMESLETSRQNDAILRDQASLVATAENQNESLRMELETLEKTCSDLRLQLFEEKRQKLEEIEENDMFKTIEKLTELQAGVSTVRSHLSECVERSGSHGKDTSNETHASFSSGGKNTSTWEGSETRKHSQHLESCILEDRTAVKTDCSFDKSNNMLGSASKQETFQMNWKDKDRDATIILLRKEMESALECLKGVQVEMAKLRFEKETLRSSEQKSKESIGDLLAAVTSLQTYMDKFEQDLALKVDLVDNKLRTIEGAVQESSNSWYEQKKLLAAELCDAKAVAAQKATEASCTVAKFGEVQDTMKEADIMINELMIANESLKLDIKKLKKKEISLTKKRDILVNENQNLQSANDQKDMHYQRLENEFESDLVMMQKLVLELEDIVSQTATSSMDELMSVTSDVLIIKSQLHESIKYMRSWLEEIWSDIVMKDCSLSVLHLCHMGILLEAATGLNVENGLLNHGLSESNSLISKLKEQNFKAQKELEMCRTLKVKLLADIKNNFDRVLRKESDAVDLTSKLGSFEKKILDLQFQEEAMLARSEQMGSELVELIKEIALSNKTVLASLIDQQRVLKDKEEALKSLEDNLTVELSAKDFESLILSSELEERTLLISQLERQNKHFYEVAEGLKRQIIFDNLDVALTASILLDKEVEVSILQEEVAEAGRKQQNLLAELSVMDSMMAKVHARKDVLEQDACSLMEVSCLNETLKRELGELMEGKAVLTTQVQELNSKNEKLLEELQKKDSALESSSSRIFVLDQQNQMLKNETCLLEAASQRLQNDMEMKDAEINKMNCLEKEIEELQHVITELKGERCQLFQELEVNKAENESINALAAENTSLRIQLRSYEKVNNDTFNMVLKVDRIGSKALNAFQNKSAELDTMLQNIYEELERASKFFEEFESLENCVKEILIQCSSLQTELVRKDEIIKGMLFDLSLLQESASNHMDQKDEIDDLMVSISSLENELDEAVCKGQALEVQLQEKISKIAVLESDISQKCKDIELLSRKNSELATIAKDAMEEKCSIEEELSEKREACENLEIEITNFGDIVGAMSNSIECLKRNISDVTSEKEDFHGEILTLKKELETAQTLAEESEANAIEAKEEAETAKLHAEEKEEEVKLLERSVEELECTVNILENEVEFVRGEAERQRLQREELELEFHAIKQQMSNVKGSDADMRRHQEEKEKSLQEACQRIQLLEGEIISRDAELAHFKAHISELNLHAEAQAREYKEKFKALEALAQKVKMDPHATQAPALSSSKLEKNSSKPRGSGSPFKCIGIGLVQQLMSEKDEEHSAERHRIQELEALAASRQKEIFMLNSKLAAAESMTHDVIRDLLGLKLDMNNYANLLDNKQLQMLMEVAGLHNVDAQFKEEEVPKLRQQLNEFIEERKGWIEEIERKQAEMVAAQIALEKLRQRDHLLTTENEMIKLENANHKKKVRELEADIKKLSGQQNLQQRIHHHAKIKEENNLLKNQNDDLIVKLRKTESILSRVREELTHFRQTNGRGPYINFDKEEMLENKLKEKEEERLQLAQKLLGLCASVLKAAGITKPTSDMGISAAEEALEQLKNRLTSLERELQDAKFKNKMTNERIRLTELMPQSSPLRTGENGQISNGGSSSPLTAFDR
ncbi:kinesin-like protein KIN-12D [Capsicum chacoense]|uniref:Phragmoplast orienting kinesin 2 n=1 Tax=Capsicum annuum TaxID=4072 RepID=A0A2G2Y3P8_CAPAN|nr:Phragmoplast orienting kinesin 2 [Capsicum annuum]PHT64377.1 Phragmoplast orienting kinesin 2 [Capsicum annuum]